MTNGVREYAEFTVSIYFEAGHVCCQYCPLLTESPRYQCRRTGELIVEPKHVVGNFCPLQPKEPPND